MNQFIRKHRMLLGAVIVLFIGVPMIFFFGPPPFWEGEGARPGGRVVATVGNIPIQEEQYINALNQAAQRQAMGGPIPTMRELQARGVPLQVLEQLINSALITHEQRARDFRLEPEFADRKIRDWDIFQDEQGRFDARTYNHWVQTQQARGLNWNSLRLDIQDQVGREMYLNAVLASANRVRESDIERELRAMNVPISMRYTAIEAPAEVTEEEIAAHFEENQEFYRFPDQRVADFVALSLRPDPPVEALNLVEQVGVGDDLDAVAQELLEMEAQDIGWLTALDRPIEHRRPAFELAVGEVSAPVYGVGGYYVYQVVDERVDEITEEREVQVQQLFFPAELPQEAREAVEADARSLHAQALEAGDLQAVAAEAGLELRRTEPFDAQAAEIEGIPRGDRFSFVQQAAHLEAGALGELIIGQDNVYVAQVVEVLEGTIPPLEEVREQVAEDALAAKRQQPEYQQQVQEYAMRIREAVDRLEQIPQEFPELEVDIRTSSPFTRQDWLFQEGLFLQTSEVYDALAEREPGAMAGPFTDFRGEVYFVELAERIEPTEEEMAEWPEQREEIRERLLAMAEMEYLDDYLLDLRERAVVNIQINDAALREILQRGEDLEDEPLEPETLAVEG